MSGSSIGSIIGFFVGNAILPGIGGSIGTILGGAIGGALAPQHIKGPSIGDAQTQTAQAGVPRPIVLGHPAPFAGNHIDGERIARKVIVEVQQGKGGGPVTEEEHFYLTSCIRISEGPIGAVIRVKRQGKPVYDIRPLEAIPGWDGPDADKVAQYFSEMQAANTKFLENTRFYLGGEDQLPDPALEMLHGVGNTPYYRGTSHMVREDEDVTDFGGALPGYQFEVVSCAFEPGGFVVSGTTGGNFIGSNTVDWTEAPLAEEDNAFHLRYIDANGQTVIGTTSDGYFFRSTDGGVTFTKLETYAIGIGGRIVYGSGRWVATLFDSGSYRFLVSVDDGETWEASAIVSNGGETALAYGDGVFLASFSGFYTHGVFRSTTGLTWLSVSTVGGQEWAGMCWNGTHWMASGTATAEWSTNGIGWIECVNPVIYGYAIAPIPDGFIIGTFGGEIYKVDNTGSTKSLRWYYTGMGDAPRFYSAAAHDNMILIGAGGGGTNVMMASTDYGDTWNQTGVGVWESEDIGTVWAGGSMKPGADVGAVEIPDSPGSYVDPDTGAISMDSPGKLLEYCNDLTLAYIERQIAERCNVPANRFDVDVLEDIFVPGYLIARQATGADCLRPLCTAYFHDLPEVHGIKAVKRGGSAVTEITDADLLMEDADPLVQGQSLEYPLKVSVVTQEPEADYAPIPQTSERYSPDVKAASEISVDVPIPLGADEAKRIAVKLHNVFWSQAEGTEELPLPQKYMGLIVSDAITRNNRRWMIQNSNRADRSNRIRVVYDRESSYHSIALGNTPATPTPPGTGLIGPTLFQWINVSPLVDSHDKLGFYVAGCGVFSGWKGATVMASIDSGATWTKLGEIKTASVMGSLLTALPDADPGVVDYANTVRVKVRGTLDSITFDQLLQERNPCIIGDELCQFQTATLISTGVYDLSVLSRARLNTEAEAHDATDRFVLLNAPVFLEAPSSWIGQTIWLRAVSNGTSPENNVTHIVEWDPALSQTEWAPFDFIGTRDGSNNVAISWNGRARMGTTAVPIHSVNFTGYRVSITKGGTTKIKNLTMAQSYAYTATEQTADFGGATGTLTITIEAMNRITGPSAALTGSVP